MIAYGYTHTAYYKRVFDGIVQKGKADSLCQSECLSLELYDKLPILKKAMIKENVSDFISDEYEMQELEIERTSGSSGDILEIYWDKSSKIKSLIPLWNERKKYGVYPTSRACFFHSISNRVVRDNTLITSPKIIFRNDNNTISFSKMSFDEKSLRYYYDALVDFQPEWIMCHPTTLFLFSQFLIKNKLYPFKQLKLIELTGELLLPEQRNYIKKAFNVPVVNHYGMRECNGIAYECEYGNMHLLDRNVYVEICDDLGHRLSDGNCGVIFITNLSNTAMPIIKYKTDDKGIILTKKCKCGRSKALVLSSGRSNDLVYRSNQAPLEGNNLFYVIEYINCFYDNTIKQFKIVQNEIDKFIVYLVLEDRKYIKDIEEIFVQKTNDYGITGVTWNFVILDYIAPDENGKLKYFTSNVSSSFQIE